MDDVLQSIIANNEALFRDANEAIRRGVWPGEEQQLVRFRCECAQPECGEAVELTPSAYERVRQNPRWFVLVVGHEVAGAEVVVDRHPRYAVVEKLGAGGAVAEETDPRS